jgi:hypothetical protein
MDLKKQSEIISCNRIKFLNMKYDLYNQLEFNKKLVYNNQGNEIKYNKYLDSLYITKKDCFYKPLDDNEMLWATNFKDIQLTSKSNIFNQNTRAKLNQDVNCP